MFPDEVFCKIFDRKSPFEVIFYVRTMNWKARGLDVYFDVRFQKQWVYVDDFAAMLIEFEVSNAWKAEKRRSRIGMLIGGYILVMSCRQSFAFTKDVCKICVANFGIVENHDFLYETFNKNNR